jgi:predicted RNase H-like HicB family nuclease
VYGNKTWHESDKKTHDAAQLGLYEMTEPVRLTIRYSEPDEEGWIVASVPEVPGALSQGKSREEARENVLDALRTVLLPDQGLGDASSIEELELLPAT